MTVATCITRDSRIARETPNRDRNRAQPVPAIELDVLAGIQDVEAAHPQADGQAEQPRLGAPATARRNPSADRRHRHRQPEEQLRVGGVRAWPASTRTRSPARPATASGTACSAATRRRRTRPTTTTTNSAASRRVIAPRGSSRIAVRGLSASNRASTSRLNPIAALRAPTMHDDNPAHLRPGERMVAPRQQRPGQRERQRKHRVAEAHERQVGRELRMRSSQLPTPIPSSSQLS